jgi:hypothetical protein
VANCTSVLQYHLHSEFRGKELISRCHGLFQVIYKNNTLQNESIWNANESYAAGGEALSPLCSLSSRRYPSSPMFYIDDPEYGPGAILGALGVYTSSASASSTASRTATPKGHSSNGGAIAGGIVGGLLVAIASIIAAAATFHRRRRSRASSD